MNPIIGKHVVVGNPEDIMSLSVMIITDAYEVSNTEWYFEGIERPFIL